MALYQDLGTASIKRHRRREVFDGVLKMYRKKRGPDTDYLGYFSAAEIEKYVELGPLGNKLTIIGNFLRSMEKDGVFEIRVGKDGTEERPFRYRFGSKARDTLRSIPGAGYGEIIRVRSKK